MVLQSELETERLLLGWLDPEGDMIAYTAWLNDPATNQFLEVRHACPITPQDTREFVTETNASTHSILCGIYLKPNHEHIGNVKLGPIDGNHARADLGFLVGHQRHWGNGYATEAIKALVAYAFSQLGLQKITAGCYLDNLGSSRVLKKVGFEREAILSSHWISGSMRVDGEIFCMLKP